MRNLQILKDKQVYIADSGGDPSRIKQLVPCIVATVWASKHMNIPKMQKLNTMLYAFFGPQLSAAVQNNQVEDQELMTLCTTLIPTPISIQYFYAEFCKQNNITLEDWSKRLFLLRLLIF